MAQRRLPLIVEPDALEARLGEPDLLVVDVGRPGLYARHHIPGSVFLPYRHLVAARGPVSGLLPDEEQLGEALSALGLTPRTHVVAYDEEGGGKAARLLWTLDVLGHSAHSLLDGGLQAWANEGHPLTAETATVVPSGYRATLPADSPAVATARYIREHLNDPTVVLLDTRSPEEYDGQKRFSMRSGHIPGAVNMDWILAMDGARNLRLKAEPMLREMLQERGVTPDKTVVVYCQTHHRSALTYVMLRALGYTKVRGYAGSWSDWGNRTDTPVA